MTKNADLNKENEFLLIASQQGHLEVVKLLIEKGIYINQTDSNGWNALHWASEKGHKEIVQILIEKGIDINQTNKDGQNALHLASERNHKGIVQGAGEFHEVNFFFTQNL